MPRFNPRIFFYSFRYALKGLQYAFRHEQSFRVQLAIACATLLLMVILRVSIGEVIVLLLVISSVLVLELLNTVLEKLVDSLKPRIHYFIAIMKDLMAAAVLVASITAATIGLLIFLPYLIR